MAKEKDRVKKAILDWLHGRTHEAGVEAIHARFPGVARTTFFRRLKECRVETGIQSPTPGIAAQEARDLVGAPTPPDDAGPVERLPVAVTPGAIARVPNARAVDLVYECVEHARKALAFCQREDGSIKNLKGFIAASAHQRASIETLARVAERINDAQKIQQIQDAMLEEIRKEAPEVAARIFQRLDAVLKGWGI